MMKPKHCRKYGWGAGDCGRLSCSRCGRAAYAELEKRILIAARQHAEILFVTFYYDPRYKQEFDDLPLFKEQKKRDEQVFRATLGKVFRALRDKARRAGKTFEYVIVFALARVKHKIHSRLHSHALITWLPDTTPSKKSRRDTRLDCPFLDKRMNALRMIAWIEKPRKIGAVARYTAKNAKTIIGKKDYAGIRVFRMSEGFEGGLQK